VKQARNLPQIINRKLISRNANVAIGKPERHVRKASHRSSKQQ